MSLSVVDEETRSQFADDFDVEESLHPIDFDQRRVVARSSDAVSASSQSRFVFAQ